MPVATAPADRSPTPETRSKRRREDRQPPSPTVVIADANPWVRRELAMGISPHLPNGTPGEARSPAEVLMSIAEPRCRVLVIDPCMPTVGQSDGLPLLRRICCLRRDLLILVLTPHPRQLLRDRGLPAQIEHVYAKSVSAIWLSRFIGLALLQGEEPDGPGYAVDHGR